jgi:hypothetical protein
MEIVLLPEAGNEPFVFSTDFPHESFDQTLPPPDRRIARARRRQSSRQGSDPGNQRQAFFTP